MKKLKKPVDILQDIAKDGDPKHYPSMHRSYNWQEVTSLMDSYSKYMLYEYTEFLLKNGYCDTDVYCEPPSAIDRFFHPSLNR